MFISAYFKETVVRIYPQPGDYLEPGIPIRISMKARVTWKNKMVKNPEGEEVVSNVNIMIPVLSDLYFDSRFEVNGVEHGILAIDKMDDFSARYLVVYLE